MFVARGQLGPLPGDGVRLIAQVSLSTLDDDLGEKRLRYERAGLPEYWVVDIAGRRTLRFVLPAEAFVGADAVTSGAMRKSLTLQGVAVRACLLPWG